MLEVDDEEAVVWTKPDDWNYDPQKPLRGLGHTAAGTNFNAAFCDGSVHTINRGIRPKVFRNLIERADGQVIDMSGL